MQQEGESVFLARDIDDAPPTVRDEADADANETRPEGTFGFLTPHPPGDPAFTFADREDDYPEIWLELDAGGRRRLEKYYRDARARSFVVGPDGHVGSGTRAWFQPGKFRLCLRCGNTQGGAARDRTRLASLSAEGRSSATTVLVGSALRWMHGAQSGMDRYTRKLLGFTDNRQDAALQAGHFNEQALLSVTGVIHDMPGIIELLADEAGSLRIVFDRGECAPGRTSSESNAWAALSADPARRFSRRRPSAFVHDGVVRSVSASQTKYRCAR